jgi:hypothetical protein
VFTGYNYNWAGGSPVNPAGKEQPFSCLSAGHEKIWERFAQSGERPYIPVVTTGWDKRPWEAADAGDDQKAVYYTGRTPALVEQFIGKAIAWVKSNPTHATVERLILLYAWNENGEGGYLTPTKDEGSVYLQAVTEALHAN